MDENQNDIIYLVHPNKIEKGYTSLATMTTNNECKSLLLKIFSTNLWNSIEAYNVQLTSQLKKIQFKF